MFGYDNRAETRTEEETVCFPKNSCEEQKVLSEAVCPTVGRGATGATQAAK